MYIVIKKTIHGIKIVGKFKFWQTADSFIWKKTMEEYKKNNSSYIEFMRMKENDLINYK